MHSFRSIRTTEEQVASLETRMDQSEQAQKEINEKLDRVLALLGQAGTKEAPAKRTDGARK